jgi:hypothetical protein
MHHSPSIGIVKVLQHISLVQNYVMVPIIQIRGQIPYRGNVTWLETSLIMIEAPISMAIPQNQLMTIV